MSNPKNGLPFKKRGLLKTRASLIRDSAIPEKHGQDIFGKAGIVFIIFVIVLGLEILADLELTIILWTIALFGVAFIAVGFMEFSLLQVIETMPMATVDSAAVGLNQFNGRVFPEDHVPLCAPISKRNCVFYQMELQIVIRNRDGNYWTTISRYTDGKPTLFTDDTGVMAIDLANADIKEEGRWIRRWVVNSNGVIVKRNSTLGEAMTRYFNTVPKNFDNLPMGMRLSETAAWTPQIPGSPMAVFENPILAGQNGFAIGRLVNMVRPKRGLAGKALIYDMPTGILSFRTEWKRVIIKRARTSTVVSMVSGMLMLICSLTLLL